MSYYMEVASDHDKAGQLIKLGAEPVDAPTDAAAAYAAVPEGKVLVWVVQNGPFDAAGIVHDQEKLEGVLEETAYEESEGDARPRTWLLMDRALAAHLSSRYSAYLERH